MTFDDPEMVGADSFTPGRVVGSATFCRKSVGQSIVI